MIKIVSCFWNAEQYISNCIKTLKNQLDGDFEVFLIDDMSTDKSVEVIKNLISDDLRFKLIVNIEKKFKLKNLDDLISTFDDEDIIVELDGDDFLLGNDVITEIKKIYNNKNVWLTNGSFMYTNGVNGFSSKANLSNIRTSVFTFSHLRTWKSWLWKKIKEEDLQDSEGNYWSVAGDLAFMFPMFEMSGEKHYRHISTITYIYNENNPLNDHKVNMPMVNSIVNIIRNKTPYNKI